MKVIYKIWSWPCFRNGWFSSLEKKNFFLRQIKRQKKKKESLKVVWTRLENGSPSNRIYDDCYVSITWLINGHIKYCIYNIETKFISTCFETLVVVFVIVDNSFQTKYSIDVSDVDLVELVVKILFTTFFNGYGWSGLLGWLVFNWVFSIENKTNFISQWLSIKLKIILARDFCKIGTKCKLTLNNQ